MILAHSSQKRLNGLHKQGCILFYRAQREVDKTKCMEREGDDSFSVKCIPIAGEAGFRGMRGRNSQKSLHISKYSYFFPQSKHVLQHWQIGKKKKKTRIQQIHFLVGKSCCLFIMKTAGALDPLSQFWELLCFINIGWMRGGDDTSQKIHKKAEHIL